MSNLPRKFYYSNFFSRGEIQNTVQEDDDDGGLAGGGSSNLGMENSSWSWPRFGMVRNNEGEGLKEGDDGM